MTSHFQGLLSIGAVAERSGVATSTLRYYDRIGLVPPVVRVGGQRRYSEDAVRRVAIIRLCQRAGFDLEEVSELLDGDGTVRELARRKLTEIDRQIDELRGARHLVVEALECGCAHLESCGRDTHRPSAIAGSPGITTH